MSLFVNFNVSMKIAVDRVPLPCSTVFVCENSIHFPALQNGSQFLSSCTTMCTEVGRTLQV